MTTALTRSVTVIDSSRSNKGERKSFANFLSFANIILLGDPGAGKTHTFQAAAKIEGVDYCTVREFLAIPGTPGKQSIVYLDGLDEYRSRNGEKNLVIELVQMLAKQGNPKIRLSCRSADWLGDSDLALFKRLFLESSFIVLNLEPLSEEEVFQILRSKNIPDPEEFTTKAKSFNLAGLLGNPQTLIMLADVVRNGTWPATRKELFEKSCSILLDEHNTEHARSVPGSFHSSELVEPAGAVSATLLISGASGVSLLPGSSVTNEYPSYKTIAFQPEEKLQACLMRRCFSFIDTEQEAVTYIHRTMAEFLGAQWLAGKVRAGYPFYRALSLIGKDGCPASELRGLYAWLPVFLPEHAEICLKNDSYGVLTYGDAASLSPSLRKILLENMNRLAKSDPWFRAGNWAHEQLGALSGEDMVDSFRDILQKSTSFHLRTLILEAIVHGPELPQVKDLLLNILESSDAYDEAALAVEALLRVVPGSKEKIIDIFHATLKKNPETARLRGTILSRLYENTFQSEDVLSICHDVLHDTKQHAIGELWGMTAALPVTTLPDILDALCALDTGEDFDGKIVNQHIIESVFERLLNRLLQSGFTPQPEQLWNWLSCLNFLEGQYGAGVQDDIRYWLKQNKSLVFAMLLSAIKKVEEDKGKYWLFLSKFDRITMHTLVGEDLIRMVFTELERKSEVSAADHSFYEKCGPQIFQLETKLMQELLVRFQAIAKRHPSLQPICDACCRCEIDDWRRRDNERQRKHKEKEEKQRTQTLYNLEKARHAIKSGEHFHYIGFLAQVYFGKFSDIDRSLSPHSRLSETIGEDYVDLALSGFAAILERDDLPTPNGVALSLAQNKCWQWWHGVLAGINEAWLRQGKSLQNFSDDLLKSALAIATELPVDSEGDQDRQWLPQLLTERPDIVEYVYGEIARTQLQHKKTHITVLYHLQRNEETKNWRSRVALKLLKQFPCCSPNFLEPLILAGLYTFAYRDALIQQAKHGIMSCYGKQRKLWLIIAFLLKPTEYGNVLKRYSTRHKSIVWLLRDMEERAVIQETDHPLQLSISQLECCILVAGRAFQNISRPKSVTCGNQNPWDAAEWVWENINKLAANPSSESTEALQRLLAETSLASYHDYLRHSLANQAIVRREAEFRQPSWMETVESLKGGNPANIADLHALVLDQLRTLQKEIQDTNTDPYKSFWRCDSNGKVNTPEIKDVCRDRLIDLIRPLLVPLNLHVEPEGHMAADKRADILILGPIEMKLPIELKRDFHKDLWTACANQLERMYTQDPDAADFGIYGVFWFGDRGTSKMKKPPAGIATPQSAEKLEAALQSLVPMEQQEKIRVVVFDVTPPYEG